MAKILSGTRIWTYQMQGTIPGDIPDVQIEAIVRASVQWADTMLTHLRGSTVTFESITADELARRLGQKSQ